MFENEGNGGDVNGGDEGGEPAPAEGGEGAGGEAQAGGIDYQGDQDEIAERKAESHEEDRDRLAEESA